MTAKYTGMNASGTGTVSDADHVWQSAADILNTPLNSRVMRRNYGSVIPDLIDSPQNAVTRMQMMSGVVIALAAWEPRIAISSVTVTYSNTGKVTAEIEGALTESMESTTGIIELGAS